MKLLDLMIQILCKTAGTDTNFKMNEAHRELSVPEDGLYPQEGQFDRNSGRPLRHAFFSKCVMIGCIHSMCIRGRRR
jgi:hypothetical protein